eukprot:COSAG02_NODE_6227_length_3714_cov_1.599447_6_plen_100_part_01
MAYCTVQQPRRRLQRQRLHVDWPQPTCGAALLAQRAGRAPVSITLFSDDEQPKHFPLPFKSAGGDDDVGTTNVSRKDIASGRVEDGKAHRGDDLEVYAE